MQYESVAFRCKSVHVQFSDNKTCTQLTLLKNNSFNSFLHVNARLLIHVYPLRPLNNPSIAELCAKLSCRRMTKIQQILVGLNRCFPKVNSNIIKVEWNDLQILKAHLR